MELKPSLFMSGGIDGIPLIWVPDTEVENVGDDPAGRLIYENLQPLNHGEGDVVGGDAWHDAIAFHENSVLYHNEGEVMLSPQN